MLGANGSGKSTLLAVCSMALWPSSGSVDVLVERFGAADARELRRRIGSAGRAIETARHAALEPWWHIYTAADAARAGELGDHLGLKGRLDQAFGTLSAGERRRVTIVPSRPARSTRSCTPTRYPRHSASRSMCDRWSARLSGGGPDSVR